ncbi:MAG: hypothetical protein E3J86_14895 [Candidatus Thorarchaeota archaeon]|nr:MAG: hypothetical protein E3J86_14895 [Candidatus Thorarchaeota archaeon]
MDIEKAISRAEEIVLGGYSVEKDWVELQGVLRTISEPTEPHPHPPTHEQHMRLYRMSVDLMLRGFPVLSQNTLTHDIFADIMFRTGFDSPFDKRFRGEKFSDIPERYFQIADVIFHMMKDVVETVVEHSESVMLVDSAVVEIGGFNRRRGGFVAVTENRVFFIGFEHVVDKKYSERHYILYPDLETKPHYGSLDYIYLNNIKNVKLDYGRRDKLVIDLHTIEYTKMKPRYFFGPLFFKTRLDDKVKRRVGPFRLTVRIPRPKAQSKEFHLGRYKRLLSLLQRTSQC